MPQHSLTWLRATVASVLSFGALVLMFFYVPHWILTALHAPSRDIRAWMATGWIAIALGASCYAGWRATGRSTTSAPAQS